MSQQPEFVITAEGPAIVTSPDGRIVEGARFTFQFGNNRIGQLTFTIEQVKRGEHLSEISAYVRASLGG